MIVVDGVAREIELNESPRSSGGVFDLLESSYDNAGNIVHAEAPFSMWDDGIGQVVDGRQIRRRLGISFDETVDFANRNASHFVLSAANFILFEGMSPARRQAYRRLRMSLERLEVPLVVLGMGVQAQRRWNPTSHELPAEAVELMKFLGEKCDLISVRGEFTASIFRDYAGVHNTAVTGCPSFFQNPSSFAELRHFMSSRRLGGVAFSATNFGKPAERQLMERSIGEQNFWIEVHNEKVHRFAVESQLAPELAVLPEVFRSFAAGSQAKIKRAELVDYFGLKYRRFHDMGEWLRFTREHVRFSYGTRFHGNMATLVAGRPALWVVHDSRTTELVKTLHLPNVSLSHALETSTQDLENALSYEETFDYLDSMFTRFNDFLDACKLPSVQKPS